MNKRFDIEAVVAMIAGTILLVMINVYRWEPFPRPQAWMIGVSTAVVVMVSAVYGVIAGALVPIAACTITGLAFWNAGVVSELVALLILGMMTGHYMDKFDIGRGNFRGLKIVDYAVVEAALAIVIWIFVTPLCKFYVNGAGLSDAIHEGVFYLGITFAIAVCICLPLLLLFNSLFKKRQTAIDTRREYLYERNRS